LVIFFASGMSRWLGHTWLTVPSSNASKAPKGLGVKTSSAALPYPRTLSGYARKNEIDLRVMDITEVVLEAMG